MSAHICVNEIRGCPDHLCARRAGAETGRVRVGLGKGRPSCCRQPGVSSSQSMRDTNATACTDSQGIQSGQPQEVSEEKGHQ